jgi:S1-C subfamily serine protease
MKPRLRTVPAVAWITLLALLATWLLTWESPAVAQPAPGTDAKSELATQSLMLQRARQAVLGVQAVALDGARSNAMLGQARSGSGVLISSDGLVLTIGYLVLEADQVQLVHDDGRSVPARVLGYDVATGFGLVQALAPLVPTAPSRAPPTASPLLPILAPPVLQPVPLGQAQHLLAGQPLMIASGGDGAAVSNAQLVSRRSFSGVWEYHIDGALFTVPPRRDHSGAGLFNPAGELVGIGSLVVADASGADGDLQARQSGNMFVPVDLLLPILDELRQNGRSAASQRAWLGLNCVEHNGSLRVVRVNDDSPADVAGLQVGDRILRIDGTEVRALATLWQTLWTGGSAEREVTLEIVRDRLPQTLKVYSVDRMKTLRRAEFI